ncbi:uncharacterized protein EKO05_0004758 [Ascochyta rabiei]|uniref:CFEM domain-containing protein n=1 Tax=Didymella rabiei TaxID=5454 RepID=A0A163KF65_DIDRA|nr:uncharacterized protein EKO05_0004758 [Ascochyta rabiei]KZM26959.1 hypothetical protein ST47_g1885 [Ascochyta rabiei]UPX14269.1 hypothetical protein EKO05_0004758 [Ascochyta rabiei]
MRFSTFAAFATSLAIVSAQTPDLSSVPDCAVACLIAAIPGSGCGVSDVTCQCTTGQASITSSLGSCIPSRCSVDDSAKVAPALAGVCSAAGISVSVPASATASSAAASVASSASAAISSAASAVSSALSSAASAASSRVASASTTGSASHSGSASATKSGPAQSTGGAVANVAGLGAVMLGVFVAAL